MGDQDHLEVSVVIPCLNEAETVGRCIDKALLALKQGNVHGEIIVADNGSVDGSREIARRSGACVVEVDQPGYGAAIMGGIAQAKGKFVVIADADESYDFLEICKFVFRLREGFSLVMGCRLPSGGGQIKPNAMPRLHRWIGNPVFSYLGRIWFHAPVNDIYCGMRGFDREFIKSLDLHCTGMEFATEMIIKASKTGAKISEIPITLYPDGRKAHPSHLKIFRDGWRTLRFFLICSPRWLFWVPGSILIILGTVAYGLVFSSFPFGRVVLDAHTLLFGTLSVLAGYQLFLFALFTKTFGINEKFIPKDEGLERVADFFSVERGIMFGFVSFLAGCGLLISAVQQWHAINFGHLNYSRTMRWVVPGAMFTYLGIQTIFSSFFLSILRMRNK